MKRNRKYISPTGVLLALLAAVLFGLPLFGDRKRNPENYLTGERKEQLEAFANRLLNTDLQVAVIRHRRQEPAFSGARALTRELEQEVADVMEGDGWELLEIHGPPKPMVTLGSYSGRTWVIYVYSPEGPATAARCSPRLIVGNWYYCEY